MGSVSVAEEAANHLWAILLAFNRDIFGRLLQEADDLASSGQPNAAVLIAGTVLEYLEHSPASQCVPAESRDDVESWRQLRNQAAHGSGTVTPEQAQKVVQGVREIVDVHDAFAHPAPDVVRHTR